MALFDAIRHWRARGMSRREIARRLHVDVKTVRRQILKIEAGAEAPIHRSLGSKLAPFQPRIAELASDGRSAWSIYVVLRTDGSFDASYELVKKHVAKIRVREPQVYERLTHLAGDEMQADFGELMRVTHQGAAVRTWAYVGVWPYSRWRYACVVLDQRVATFLGSVQSGIRESGAIPKLCTIDNLAAGVLREHFHERSYQREFAMFCAHYDMMPNAVRPRTPTDKGMVENNVGSLKKFLRGMKIETLEELIAAVGAYMRTSNERPHSVTGKRPCDLIEHEHRHELPEPYPLADWSEHRVRTDCHVQVLRNFYSVPYKLVGKTVVVRLDAHGVTIYDDFVAVARHVRSYGRGVTLTDRSHYPPHKQKGSHAIHQERLLRVREVGPGAAAFLHGLLQSREHVHSDSYRALMRLIAATEAATLDRACARAAHFGNYSLQALRDILSRRLFELPLDDLATPLPARPAIELIRPLEAYRELIGWPSC
ncbi:MAG: IS21 family transposase [Candidatus Eremiobacteraeota bacterium]|nr:IS21 family transposase [Candidatus Eremiobacteraeota bacterium]MBC5824107.1 IS21 family transposase [Candidatus Eremiobacteraeota bacterium]